MGQTEAPTIKKLETTRLASGPQSNTTGGGSPEAKRQIAEALQRALASQRK